MSTLVDYGNVRLIFQPLQCFLTWDSLAVPVRTLKSRRAGELTVQHWEALARTEGAGLIQRKVAPDLTFLNPCLPSRCPVHNLPPELLSFLLSLNQNVLPGKGPINSFALGEWTNSYLPGSIGILKT